MSARVLNPEQNLITDDPYYQAVGNEIEIFEAADQQKLPILLKGPTGCGKTRWSTWPGV